MMLFKRIPIDKATLKNKKFWFYVVVLILALFGLISVLRSAPVVNFAKKIFVRQPTMHAVHLTNNQVYFGRIDSIKSDKIVLTHAYYLESFQAATPDAVSAGENFQVHSNAQTTWQLVKQGGDKTVMTDQKMIINRQAVLFWEKLKPEADVAKLIWGNENK